MADSIASESIVLDEASIDRSLTRIAHEIIEHNKGIDNIALVGIVTRGDVLARRLQEKISAIESRNVPIGRLDISFYRDDFAIHLSPEVLSTDILFEIDGKDIILIDDVLFTGRTIRAALDALMDIGRPKTVQLGVLVDRGHRELPIRADYVGKNIPTSDKQTVKLLLEETDGISQVEVVETQGRIASAPLGGDLT